jgi:hypothetical protein
VFCAQAETTSRKSVGLEFSPGFMEGLIQRDASSGQSKELDEDEAGNFVQFPSGNEQTARTPEKQGFRYSEPKRSAPFEPVSSVAYCQR